MSAANLKGNVIPLFTQFNQLGNIDVIAMEDHTDFLIDKGVDAIFVGGSAGEFIALDLEERQLITERIARKTNSKLPFLVHVTTANLRDSLRLVDHSIAEGADALVSVSPWFWKHDDESLARFFGAIAIQAKETPVYLYNMPHTGNDIKPELVQLLVERHPNIIGLKNSQDDLTRTITYSTMPHTKFFTGSDITALFALSHGADGIISGMANVVPELFVALTRAFNSANPMEALEYQIALHQFARLFAGDIRKMKAGAEIRGLGSRRCREPLGTLTDQEYEQLREKMLEMRFVY